MTNGLTLQLRLYADYRQFYVADYDAWRRHDAETDTSRDDFWSPEALDRGLAVLPKLLGVATASYGFVEVSLEVRDDEPNSSETAACDRVADASLHLSSGSVVVIGSTDPDGAVASGFQGGWYRARVCSKGLDGGVEAGEGSDSYSVILWPERVGDPPR